MRKNTKISAFSGQEWLLQNDPTLRGSGVAIRNVGALARKIIDFQDRPCGAVRFDLEVEGVGLAETLAAPEPEEVEGWRKVELGEEFETLLCLLREEGTAKLARRIGCTQRSVQLKLKKMIEGGACLDLMGLSGEVVK